MATSHNKTNRWSTQKSAYKTWSLQELQAHTQPSHSKGSVHRKERNQFPV